MFVVFPFFVIRGLPIFNYIRFLSLVFFRSLVNLRPFMNQIEIVIYLLSYNEPYHYLFYIKKQMEKDTLQ